MGVIGDDEHPYTITPSGRSERWIKAFWLRGPAETKPGAFDRFEPFRHLLGARRVHRFAFRPFGAGGRFGREDRDRGDQGQCQQEATFSKTQVLPSLPAGHPWVSLTGQLERRETGLFPLSTGMTLPELITRVLPNT
jgi:hypothetical protein